MALDVESVVGCCMHKEKSLRGSHALEPLHLAFSSSGRLMRILRSVVAPSAALMAICDSKITGCSSIRSQVICDELVWDKTIFLQKLEPDRELIEIVRGPRNNCQLLRRVVEPGLRTSGLPTMPNGRRFGPEQSAIW
jgi:hypothetical protein